MELTADMQEGGVVCTASSPKIHVHKRTISGRQPQDIITASSSFHAHLCCITRPVCLYYFLSVCVCVNYLKGFHVRPPHDSALPSPCRLNGTG